ncbi:MAG: HD-GYP domain-containing protein [Clostridia bacterium]|nr:HD-GYP domain-containing protein [Clostridia bacterium]
MNKMEISRQHIQKMARLLYRIATIAKIVIAVMIIAQLILTVAIFITPKAAMFLGPRMESNFIFLFLRDVAGIKSMEPVYQAAIGCFVLLISYVVLFMLVKVAAQILKYLANGERPLDAEKAKKIRHHAWYMLLFIFYNPVLALVSFAMVVLFSYILEYGGYVQDRADQTNRIQEEMIMSFAEITENKSGQTGQHIKRVSEYSRVLAEQLGLSRDQVENIRIASTMHDVGKLLIPSEILEKPGKLTDEEYATIKTHTTLGGQLLKNVEGEEMHLSRTIALQHHERPDGRGYPKGLTGDQISLEGRIVAVADVYDALTSRRSYKDAWSEDDAYQEILKGRGTQFDPQVVDAFVKAHDQILEVQKKFRD